MDSFDPTDRQFLKLTSGQMRKKNSMEKGLVSSFSDDGFARAPPSRFDYHPSTLPSKDGLLSRVPYSSLAAFFMCLIGVTGFSVMMVWAFNASVEQTRRALNITDIPWLDKVQIMFVITAILMATVSLVLLVIGILGTGSTREEVYRRESSRRGGRASCVVAIGLSYLLNVLWMLVVSITAILSFVYWVFSELCSSLIVYRDDKCLDLSVFRPLIKDISDSTLVLCGGNVQQFCALTNTVLIWYLVGYIGSLIVCLGLVQFIATNAANHAHISAEKRHSELQEVLFTETGGAYPPNYSYKPAMDFHVDYHPQYPPNYLASAGGPPKKLPPPMPPTLTPQQQSYLAGQQQPQQPPRMRNNASTVMRNPTRRNSYHNSLNGSSGWLNTLH